MKRDTRSSRKPRKTVTWYCPVYQFQDERGTNRMLRQEIKCVKEDEPKLGSFPPVRVIYDPASYTTSFWLSEESHDDLKGVSVGVTIFFCTGLVLFVLSLVWLAMRIGANRRL